MRIAVENVKMRGSDMTKLTRVVALAVILGLVALASTGCSRAAEEISEEIVGSATGTDVEIDEEGDSVTITTEGEDGGEITIEGGEGATVPDSYPSDFPLYDGDVVGSSALTTGEGSMVTVAVETTDDIDTIKGFFTKEFEDNGWTVLFTTEMTEGGVASVTWSLEKDGRNASVAVSDEEGMTVVNHTVLASTE